MTIEIYSPKLKVNEKVVDIIEKKVSALSHLSEKVSRAEIFLTEDIALKQESKVCKIRLDIFGDTLFVQKNSTSFENAVIAAVKVLKKLLKKKSEKNNVPPDEITSTVKV